MVNFGLSDHSSIQFGVKHEQNCLYANNEMVEFRPITKLGLFHLHNRMENVDWSFTKNSSIELNEKWCLFINIIIQTCENCFPILPRKIKNHKNSKWFNEETS